MAGLPQEFKKQVLAMITKKRGDIRAAAEALGVDYEQAFRIKKKYGRVTAVKPSKAEIVILERERGKSIATIAFEHDFDIRLVRQYCLNRSSIPVTTSLSMDKDELAKINTLKKNKKGDTRNARGELAAKQRKLERLLIEVERLRTEISEMKS